MNLHKSSIFKDAIKFAGDGLELRPELVEKDYWVTYVLEKLAYSKFANQVIFKGGTSLSKAHNCLNRFSEDIDLALLPQPDLSESKIKKMLSEIDHEITQDLEYISGIKRGRNRTTDYQYPQIFKMDQVIPIKTYIKLELNSFTNPVPHQSMEISSYLQQYLTEVGNLDAIKEFEMESFHLNVLTLERTFFEKLMAINRLSYNGSETLKLKVRHFYDLHQLYHNTHLKSSIFNTNNFEILELVLKDDERLKTFHGDWLGKPLSNSPLFTSIEDTWQKLESHYYAGLKPLVNGSLAAPAEIIEVLKMSKSFLEKFDQQAKKQAPVTLN